MAWLWLSLLIFAVVVAVVTKKNAFACFAPSALISSVLDFFNANLPAQIITYVLSSAVFVFVYYFVASNFINAGNSSFTMESIVGEKCVVVEKIDNFSGCGLVKVRKQFWSARGAYDDETYEMGETLVVVAIEGVKLICKKI